MKKIRYFIEAVFAFLLYGFFKILPASFASGTGGFLGRVIGPNLAASRKALRNIEMAMPETTEEERAAILKKMWKNLGRVMAEYPHLEYLAQEKTEIINREILDHHQDKPVIFFSGHLGNWELIPLTGYLQTGRKSASVYRAPNNPYIDFLLYKQRRKKNLKEALRLIPKSRSGTRQLVQTIQDGLAVGILIDQKYNEGVPAPFFGRPAMTSTAFIELAQRFDCALIPIHIVRTRESRFQLIVENPVEIKDKDGKNLAVDHIMQVAHQKLEGWIRENPGQWLWLHRRWNSKRLKEED